MLGHPVNTYEVMQFVLVVPMMNFNVRCDLTQSWRLINHHHETLLTLRYFETSASICEEWLWARKRGTIRGFRCGPTQLLPPPPLSAAWMFKTIANIAMQVLTIFWMTSAFQMPSRTHYSVLQQYYFYVVSRSGSFLNVPADSRDHVVQLRTLPCDGQLLLLLVKKILRAKISRS